VYWRSIYCLPVLNMSSILDSRLPKKFEYWRSTYSLCTRNMTPTNCRLSLIKVYSLELKIFDDCYPNILNIQANASSKYVCTIYSFNLRSLYILHIKPRILTWNINTVYYIIFMGNWSEVQKFHFQLTKIKIITSWEISAELTFPKTFTSRMGIFILFIKF